MVKTKKNIINKNTTNTKNKISKRKCKTLKNRLGNKKKSKIQRGGSSNFAQARKAIENQDAKTTELLKEAQEKKKQKNAEFSQISNQLTLEERKADRNTLALRKKVQNEKNARLAAEQTQAVLSNRNSEKQKRIEETSQSDRETAISNAEILGRQKEQRQLIGAERLKTQKEINNEFEKKRLAFEASKTPAIPEALQAKPPIPAPYVPVEQQQEALESEAEAEAEAEAELQEALPEIPVEISQTQIPVEEVAQQTKPPIPAPYVPALQAPIQEAVFQRQPGFKAESRTNFTTKLREKKVEKESDQPALQEQALQPPPALQSQKKQVMNNNLRANINRRLQGAHESKKRGNEASRLKKEREQAQQELKAQQAQQALKAQQELKAQQAPLPQQKSKFCYI